MITLKIDDSKMQHLLRTFPRETARALEVSLDRTAFAIRKAIRQEMPQVFDRPTPYTLNSLRVTPTKNHNMRAEVWFKEPDRMTQHYLVPQVHGGPRKLKGFERALGGRAFLPARRGFKLDRYGNLPYGWIVQILSVLQRAEYVAGYMANLTERSAKRNRRPRDYVWLKERHGKLPPGIYERFQTGVGFGAKTKKHLPFGVWQKGRRKGRFASVIRARGLRPVLIEGRKNVHYRPRLPFYDIAMTVVEQRFNDIFSSELDRRLPP